MAAKIFISYRHSDNPDVVRRVRDWLVGQYGNDNIFLDSYSIPAGMPFARYIEIKIREFDVVLAIIGPDWLKILREKASLFQDDYVRKELEWSLKYGKAIVPVCIKNGALPNKTDLPEELRSLLDLNAVKLDDGANFEHDLKRIAEGFEMMLRDKPANDMPAYLFNGNSKADFLESHLGNGWGSCMSLSDHPQLMQGKSWAMGGVQIQARPIKFTLPAQYKSAHQDYVEANAKRFVDDGDKIMLSHAPDSSIDSPTLVLETLQTKYSMTKFYAEQIASDVSVRDQMISTLFDEGKIQFAHSLCMHAVIVTSDDKVLITQRSWRVAYYPHAWQCTLSEQFAKEDFTDKKAVLHWGRRMLEEELSLHDETAYNDDNLRLLSVFLEGELLNTSVCAYVTLNLDAATLDRHLRANPPDPEFNGNWIFVDHKKLFDELFTPSRVYHPSSPYLMYMALLHRYGQSMRDKINERLATISAT